MNHASSTFNNYLVHQLAELTAMLRLTGYTVEAGELAAELYQRLRTEQYRAAGVRSQHEETGVAPRTTSEQLRRAHQSRLQALLVSRRLLAEIIRACPHNVPQSLEAMAAELEELERLFELTMAEVREARTRRKTRAELTTSQDEREYRRSRLATAREMRQAIVEHKAQLDTYKKLPPQFRRTYRPGQPDRAAGNVAEALTTITDVLQQPSVPVDDTDMPSAPPKEQRDAQAQARATPTAIPLTITGLAEATRESESTIRNARKKAGIAPWGRGQHGVCFSPEQVRQIAEQRFSSRRCNREAWNQLLKDINQPPVS